MIHSEEFLALTEEARARVREIAVAKAVERQAAGATLIDVREDNEWNGSHAVDAVHLGRGIIERDIVQAFPEKDSELILYCGGGYRSALAAESLQRMGYTNVWSLAGGWKAWQEADAPVEWEIPY